MGYLKEKEIWKFLKDLGKNLKQFDRKYGIESSYDMKIRYGAKAAAFDSVFFYSGTLQEIAEAFDETEYTLADFSNDPDLEVYISCEGGVYERVYLHSASGGSEKNKALSDAFTGAAAKYGLYMEFYDGALGFCLCQAERKAYEEKLKSQKV